MRPGSLLLRLLMVLLALGVVSVLVYGLAGWSSASKEVEHAKKQLAALGAAFEDYRKNHPRFPQVLDQTGAVIYVALSGDGVGPDREAGTDDDTAPDRKLDPGAQCYLDELLASGGGLALLPEPAQGDGQRVVDPWGNGWHYRSGSDRNVKEFDLWSAGPDGVSGNADDITSW